MTTLTVDILQGIDRNTKVVLWGILEKLNNKQRLCLGLYFMSDLPDTYHHLSRIEQNLLELYEECNDKDFAAGKVRGYFNAETKKVKAKMLLTEERLWRNLQSGSGYWRNTNKGNSYALNILREHDIIVIKRGIIQNPTI